METKINIATILKDKPQGTKLYDLLYNIDVELNTISTTDTETVVWCTNETDNNTTCHRGYSEFGTVRGCSDGLQILLPSKSMREWRKFSWKKGDVLVSNDSDSHIIFKGFSKNDYTTFEGKHWISVSKKRYVSCLNMQNVQDYHIEDNKDSAQTYINTIEERLGGKLNRETLEVEKSQPEFKDGDMVSLEIRYIDSEDVIIETYIVHGDYNYGEELNFYTGCNNLCMIKHDSCVKPTNTSVRNVFIRYATDSEKQQLFSALAKENKAWDSEKKEVVDLKPKVELKPFDKVLVRNDKEDQWSANIFSYQVRDNMYYCLGECYWRYCIPYEGNEHLLGTTKDVEG